MICCYYIICIKFYDNSIFSGTKIVLPDKQHRQCFTITQFFQVLKFTKPAFVEYDEFYDNSIFSGTTINCGASMSLFSFTITQFFQVLKCQTAIFN